MKFNWDGFTEIGFFNYCATMKDAIWYDEYVVFENPGHMLVTKSEFFSPFRSAPRNEVIF